MFCHKKNIGRYCIVQLQYRAIIKQLHLKGLRRKQIYEKMLDTLADKCPSYSILNILITNFKTDKFSIEDEDRSRRSVLYIHL